MSDFYDNYHRWEPLAEFHFNLDNCEDEDLDEENNYVYCLCSRVLTREVVKTYEPEKYGSESDVDLIPDIISSEVDDHSHVHFSLDTSYKVKCDKDEGASCYCSASHTDNYCSTDEQEAGQILASHALQPSDSGADLTYQDYHLEYTPHDKLDELEEDVTKQESYEDYLSEDTWEKFWAVHGERLIWASWIKRYSDYINPDYLDENNDLLLDENNIPKKHDTKNIDEIPRNNENIRERKYSYDSKINPHVKNNNDVVTVKQVKNIKESDTKDDTWISVGRRRYSSEHERIVSPKTLAATDSMTNVTKVTLSSYNVTSSHVTSDSTPTDGYSITSSTSDDQFNDQTRIANVDENTDQVPSEELDNDQYWQFLWKKHFGEQYALHCAYYIECHSPQCKDVANDPDKPVDIKIESLRVSENECENSEGNSQELPSVVEVKVVAIENKTETIESEPKKIKGKKSKSSKNKDSHKVMNSVGVLLQHLLKEQNENEENETTDAGDEKSSSDQANTVNATIDSTTITTVQNSQTQISNIVREDYNEDNDPPEERSHSLKRSHELDVEEVMSERIKSTFEVMGFCLDPTKLPTGELIYKKRIGKLRPPRNKRWGTSRKTYFDDDGNPYNEKTDDEDPVNTEMNIDNDKVHSTIDNLATVNPGSVDRSEGSELEATFEPVEGSVADQTLPSDLDTISDQGTKDYKEDGTENLGQTKRRKRPKRHSRFEEDSKLSELPEELRGEQNMLKYWKKRHSLFHRFDDGIRLDLESWFSVTPENVAAHIADRCANDVILDAFCGAGGNSIQFARTCKKVIAIDIDPKKIELARHNAAVYGVTENIEFIVGDFFEVGPTITADFVFLSPPWGGPKYSQNSEYDIETMLEPKPATELIHLANKINSNIALYLPRNSKTDQIVSLARDIGSSVEIEQSFLDRRFVAITAYYY